MISILTPTVRPDGLSLVAKALASQDVQDFEWLVCSPFDPLPHCAPLSPTWVRDEFQGGFWTLNRAYNALFQASKEEMLVSWQDRIWARPDALTKLLEGFAGTRCVSGIGDQYDSLDQYGRPMLGKSWEDPRRTDRFGSFYECNPEDIEWNLAAVPRFAVFEAGGMDEELDFLGYGGDQLQLMERIAELGYECFLDQSLESYTLRHGRKEGWDEHHVLFNGEYDRRKAELLSCGEWPNVRYI